MYRFGLVRFSCCDWQQKGGRSLLGSYSRSKEHDLRALLNLGRVDLVTVTQNALEQELLPQERDAGDRFQPSLDVQHAHLVRHHAVQLVDHLAVADLMLSEVRNSGRSTKIYIGEYACKKKHTENATEAERRVSLEFQPHAAWYTVSDGKKKQVSILTVMVMPSCPHPPPLPLSSLSPPPAFVAAVSVADVTFSDATSELVLSARSSLTPPTPAAVTATTGGRLPLLPPEAVPGAEQEESAGESALGRTCTTSNDCSCSGGKSLKIPP